MLALTSLLPSFGAVAEPLRVVVTLPALGSIAGEVGGDAVDVHVFAKGTEDPHFVEPRPSFIRVLAEADVIVLNGMELEIGWLPPLLRSARNARLRQGEPGYIDASTAIVPMEVPDAVDRSQGDVHVSGNPHYLLDPLNGAKVARLVARRLAELAPEHADAILGRASAFETRIGQQLVGERLAGLYPPSDLARLAEHGRLVGFLESQGQEKLLGGWLGRVTPLHGSTAVGDHKLWPYFARRFGLRVIGHLEPKPGVPPTTRHLRALIERMRSEDVRLILSANYYDPAHARFVAENTGARIVAIAPEVGAVPGASDYVKAVDHNVRQLAGG
jgi:ABC-type Zn uptake system ZnuABC Zn-binding protein ZnuA